jgi:hypothetical protein
VLLLYCYMYIQIFSDVAHTKTICTVVAICVLVVCSCLVIVFATAGDQFQFLVCFFMNKYRYHKLFMDGVMKQNVLRVVGTKRTTQTIMELLVTVFLPLDATYWNFSSVNCYLFGDNNVLFDNGNQSTT